MGGVIHALGWVWLAITGPALPFRASIAHTDAAALWANPHALSDVVFAKIVFFVEMAKGKSRTSLVFATGNVRLYLSVLYLIWHVAGSKNSVQK